jgi:hypothetical protein
MACIIFRHIISPLAYTDCPQVGVGYHLSPVPLIFFSNFFDTPREWVTRELLLFLLFPTASTCFIFRQTSQGLLHRSCLVRAHGWRYTDLGVSQGNRAYLSRVARNRLDPGLPV